MPKLKTHKATAKRFKFTKPSRGKIKKILKRKSGQGHFNARESSRVTREKRGDISISKSDQKNIKKLLPYH